MRASGTMICNSSLHSWQRWDSQSMTPSWSSTASVKISDSKNHTKHLLTRSKSQYNKPCAVRSIPLFRHCYRWWHYYFLEQTQFSTLSLRSQLEFLSERIRLFSWQHHCSWCGKSGEIGANPKWTKFLQETAWILHFRNNVPLRKGLTTNFPSFRLFKILTPFAG